MRILVLSTILVIAVNAIVFPNAQQELLAVALIFGSFLGLRRRKVFSKQLFFMLITSVTVTFFYALVGAIRDAPSEALFQAILIYVVSPILWLIVIDLAWQYLGTERIVNALAYLAILAAATVATYMYLFLNYGPQAVAFFGSSTNVHIEEGYSGVIMHVSGSLIFLAVAFFAEPSAPRQAVLSAFTLSSVALASVASGRTAAILSLAIGASIFLFISARHLKFKRFALILLLAGSIGVMVLGLNFLLGVDPVQLMSRHIDKISGGDLERPMQINALIDGIKKTWFLGAGHGIGVEYIRSDIYNWRYEAVFLALFYKLGLLGGLVVLSPILIALGIFIYSLIKGRIRKYDAFFGSALVACFVAGFTNPYPEAFAFQWMYLIPVYYFFTTRSINFMPRGQTR